MGTRRNDGAGGTGGSGEIDPVATAGRLVRWFDRNARDLPWRRTLDPYAVWVSEIMLQQTQVQTVIPYWTRWMERLPGVHELADAPPELVLKLWEGLGYYSRARNLQRAARCIVDEHGGRFPREAAALLTLPGIGPYTAGAIASIAMDHPEPILDGNVMRVLTRLAALEGDPRKEPLNRRLWEWATTLVHAAHSTHALGDRRCSRLNQSLMELGATVCTPGARPDCARCPVSDACAARRRGSQERYPELAPRVPITPRFFATAILVHQGRHLLTLRGDTGVNRGFWEFPSWEIASSASPEKVLGEQLGIPGDAWSALPDLRHHITRYRMIQRVRLAHASPSPAAMAEAAGRGSWLWATEAELESLPLTSAHRKLARRLTEFRAESPQLSGGPAGPTVAGQ
jgi:A/G-specific adenine glycosylase